MKLVCKCDKKGVDMIAECGVESHTAHQWVTSFICPKCKQEIVVYEGDGF